MVSVRYGVTFLEVIDKGLRLHGVGCDGLPRGAARGIQTGEEDPPRIRET